jgi:hypothetical protein
MTAPRTIPANPVAGERWAELFRGQDWTVYEGPGVVIARHLTEADARLIVFGAKAVEALREAVDAGWLQKSSSTREGERVWFGVKGADKLLIDLEVPT